ncbi:hypothetical protein DERF_009843 [Dermatophagoides farinae]|uniref:Uncharacterized protein n=1 Tax=Dermatophagoides farinae TaxID=6954 RepID=A0A922HXF5_DERFA|nr:hypothetical protein DERF_009843 [Dermatophagoides farinae]
MYIGGSHSVDDFKEKRFNNVVTVLGRGCLREPPWSEPRHIIGNVVSLLVICCVGVNDMFICPDRNLFIKYHFEFDQFNWRNAIPTSHVESVPRDNQISGGGHFVPIVHIGNSHHHDDQFFPDICQLAMTGKRHRKPFVDKWGKLSDIVNIRMQLFDIGAIFIFNTGNGRSLFSIKYNYYPGTGLLS